MNDATGLYNNPASILGRTRDWCRANLGRVEVFRRVPDTPEIDYYVEFGVQVHADAKGVITFAEYVQPANPLLRGVGVLGRSLSDVVSDLRASGLDVEEDADGAVIPSERAALYAVEKVEGLAVAYPQASPVANRVGVVPGWSSERCIRDLPH